MEKMIEDIRLERYPAYKDSGVEWIGSIPSSWNIKKLKFLGKIFSGISGKKGDDFSKEYSEGMKPFIPFTNICNNRIVSENQYQYVKLNKGEIQNKVQRNDILFLMSSETLEDIARSSIYLGENIELYLNSFCKGFRVNAPVVSPEYVNYLFLSSLYRNYFSLVGRGFTRINLKQEYVNDAPIILPPLPEQTRIAAFLDRKTAQIDTAIAQKERLIELLKERRQIIILNAVTRGLNPNAPMKDSGVEWIGEVPVHWEVSMTKHVARLETGHTPSRYIEKYWKNCTIPWFTLADVHQLRNLKTIYIDETASKISELGLANSAACLLPANTVLLSRTASVGFSGIIKVPMATSQDFVNWVCGERILPIYLLFVFRAMREEFNKLVMGSTHQTIYMPDARAFRTPLPPLKEQQSIADFIQKNTTIIDQAIAAKQAEVEKLKELKSVLINSAVTGKIRV